MLKVNSLESLSAASSRPNSICPRWLDKTWDNHHHDRDDNDDCDDDYDEDEDDDYDGVNNHNDDEFYLLL